MTHIQTCRNAPNIFRYATKELSQDAVICWLVACAKEATGELRDCGMSFVRFLLRSGESRVINARSRECETLSDGDVTEIEDISPQYSNIDVFFQVKWAGELVSVVVEDKTQTEAHSGQLSRYRDIVKSDNVQEEFIKLIYFKSGYVYGDEREKAEQAGYCVIDAAEIVHFFQNGMWSTTHDFIGDFAEHVADGVEYRRQAVKSWDLDEDFVQWEFMVELASELRLPDKNDIKWPDRDVNIGGGAATTYPHYQCHSALFWRLDAWKPLRLMVHPGRVKEKNASWDVWERAFAEAANHCGLKTEKFRRIRKRKGKLVRQGTIGQVNVRDCLEQEGLTKCVERVCELHMRFVNSTNLQF